ncbi:MAG: signal peptidase I [Defluviitaleaceae bacterium]|nr:signal peptidase I [Defluviitaleaceae bacterium]
MLYKNIKNPFFRAVVEWLSTFAFAFLIVMFIHGFLFRIANVDGGSMTPTLLHGDRVILNKLVYRFSSPQAGDIVAFLYTGERSEFFIKRVIAVPGDIVDFKENAFYVNGERLDDDFSAEDTHGGDMVFPVTVQDGRYFVLGDDRNRSQDSRFVSVSTVPAGDMVGRARLRVWPLGRVGRVR